MAKKPYIWDGSNWVELSIGMPQLAYSSASPTSPFIGQIWVDASSSASASNSLKVWNGSNWEEIGLSGGDLSITAPPNISTSGSVGDSSLLARSNHTHGFGEKQVNILSPFLFL